MKMEISSPTPTLILITYSQIGGTEIRLSVTFFSKVRLKRKENKKRQPLTTLLLLITKSSRSICSRLSKDSVSAHLNPQTQVSFSLKLGSVTAAMMDRHTWQGRLSSKCTRRSCSSKQCCWVLFITAGFQQSSPNILRQVRFDSLAAELYLFCHGPLSSL